MTPLCLNCGTIPIAEDAFRELRENVARLENALKDARATLLGLQPDFGGPIAAQMGNAIQRINDALANNQGVARPAKQDVATSA